MTKPPPSLVDDECEYAVLGGILVQPSLLPLLELDVDDFNDPHKGHVLAAMRNLEAAGKPIDVVTVSDQLEADGHTNTPPSLLGECALRCPTPENVEHYAEILRRHRIGRQVDRALGVVKGKLAAGDLSGPDALVDAQERLQRITVGDSEDRGASLGAIVRGIADEISRDEVAAAGIPSGLKSLDAKTGGLPLGVPTVVLAPPSSGKSTIALTFAAGAENAGDTPILYTYEDGPRSFGLRTMARHSGVPTEKIRAGDFTRGDLDALGWHMPRIMKRRTVVVPAAGMTVEELVRDVRARRLRHKGDGTTGQLVIVDFVQNMPLPSFHGTVDQRLSHIVKTLAALAQSEHIALVICSQVGRQAPRESRPPTMADARECGQIEISGKLMLGLYRPGIYGKPRTAADDGEGIAPPTLLELHLLKNNNGESNVHLEVFWDLPTHTIVDSPDDLAERRR